MKKSYQLILQGDLNLGALPTRLAHDVMFKTSTEFHLLIIVLHIKQTYIFFQFLRLIYLGQILEMNVVF